MLWPAAVGPVMKSVKFEQGKVGVGDLQVLSSQRTYYSEVRRIFLRWKRSEKSTRRIVTLSVLPSFVRPYLFKKS